MNQEPMYVVTLRCPVEQAEFLSAELWELGTDGVIEGAVQEGFIYLQAFFATEEQARAVAAAYPQYEPQTAPADTTDWQRITMDSWQPMLVGKRFFLVPVWRDDPAPAGRLRLPIHPGLACGTGSHPCTQMCLRALEEYVGSPHTVLDVGSGTGLLTVAAHLLGARRLVACDIDPDVAEVTYTNCYDDGAAPLVYNGSAEAVRTGSVDRVVANISAAAGAALAPELVRVLRRPGIAVVSGFENHETESVDAALHAVGLHVFARDQQDGWTCLLASR